MKRILSSLAAVAALALGASAPLAVASPSPTLKLAHSALGKILVNRRAFTVYEFSRDARNKDTCAAIRGCSGVWPAMIAHGKAVAGAGLRSGLLGSIALRKGVRQVTYAGHPLYTYSFDSGPAQTDYVGARQFGGTWDALNAAGQLVH